MKWILPAIASLLLSSCILPSANVSVAPGASLSSMNKVAVWRFVDGEVKNSGDAATRALEAALMRRGVRVVPFGRIREVLSVDVGLRDGTFLEAGTLTPSMLARLRQSGADAVLLGSVGMSLSNPRYAPSNFIEINFQMVDTRSGELIASGSVSDEAWSMQQAAAKAADKALKQLR